MKLKYRKLNWQYEVTEDLFEPTKIKPKEDILTRLVQLHSDGQLIVGEDFAWDGASGPTLPWKSSVRPSAVHDAVYGLIAAGLLDKKWRLTADNMFYRMLREDGMPRIQAMSWWLAVRMFGGGSHIETKPEKDIVYESP